MDSSYIVGVIGGACAGSQIASQLANLGMDVVVFDQKMLPYGKIEDGLPRWHHKLQQKEMNSIDEHLNRPNIHYIPKCKVGEDITIRELLDDWELPLVVLANGAWRDRPLPIMGLENVRDDSFVYQNPFVYWFNHYPEPHFSGYTYSVPEEPIIIGGGLASIDVAKICQLELVKTALQKRGIEVDQIELERKGFQKGLAPFGLTYEDLDVAPTRLFYRKRVKDMPLVPLGESPTEEKIKRAPAIREKIIRNATTRYCFEVHELRVPIKIHAKDGSVTAITFHKNEYRDGRFVDIGEMETYQTQMVISSIGSIPEPIPGVPMDGEHYRWKSSYTGAVGHLPGVYCVGNAITGKGNIKDSFKNAKRLGDLITAALKPDGDLDFSGLFRAQEDEARQHVGSLVELLRHMPPLTPFQRSNIMSRVRTLQVERNYNSCYDSWRDQVIGSR